MPNKSQLNNAFGPSNISHEPNILYIFNLVAFFTCQSIAQLMLKVLKHYIYEQNIQHLFLQPYFIAGLKTGVDAETSSRKAGVSHHLDSRNESQPSTHLWQNKGKQMTLTGGLHYNIPPPPTSSS
ncbi:hypothetical protein AMECASPLE_029193 [Ameca splendens]|uniref:Uncharacterized protein n=1 Tax=Ameca splendens TaxID=208324 RepID=A0ABV0YTD8_9TELE